jgi:hypothetical protein
MPKKDDEVIAPINLDEVHMQEVHKMELEPSEPEEEPKEPVESPVETPEEPKEPVKEPEEPEQPKEEEPEEEPIVIPPEPELDTDITKPGDGKIGIKNSDGEMNYFNNLDEVPDDFEPASYKEYSKFNVDMSRKMIEDERYAKEREIAINQKAQQEEIDAVTAAWDKDIDVLTRGGILPEDEAARTAEINDVYAYISQKISEGVIVDSFAEAHKAMMYDKMKAEKIKTTKAKGSTVMGGSAVPSGKKDIEPLPAGITLDQVHQKYSGLI